MTGSPGQPDRGGSAGSPGHDGLLGAGEVRSIADRWGIRPTKQWGQNFVVDANTVRRIVRLAGVSSDDVVLEVGPGLGSLTLGLLAAGTHVVAVEIDPVLAEALPDTVARLQPESIERLTVLAADALRIHELPMPPDALVANLPYNIGTALLIKWLTVESWPPLWASLTLMFQKEVAQRIVAQPSTEHYGRLSVLAQWRCTAKILFDVNPQAFVPNLPYNVAVPVVLHLLEAFASLRSGLVMVQSEVADRLVAPPGSRTYGVPSVKLAWFARAERAGAVPASVFWPVPRVESGLVAFTCHEPPPSTASRKEVFAVVDAAFAQRRKTLRAALAGWAGSAAAAEHILVAAGVDPGARGESLDVAAFARIASARALI